MNTASSEPLTWSRSRWCCFFFLVFATQILLIFLLSSRKNHSSPAPVAARTAFQLVSWHPGETRLIESVLDSDPSLFAMATAQGFSGAAWLNQTRRNYGLSEQQEKPFWLALNPSQLGNSLGQFVRTSFNAPASFEQDSPLAVQISTIPDPTVTTRTNSQFRIEGNLAARLLEVPQLKSWATNEIVNQTEVQIGVDQDGLVISARLLAKSGSPEANRSALEVARRLSFSRVQPSGVAWGKTIFHWHTVPMSGTNAVPKATQP